MRKSVCSQCRNTASIRNADRPANQLLPCLRGAFVRRSSLGCETDFTHGASPWGSVRGQSATVIDWRILNLEIRGQFLLQLYLTQRLPRRPIVAGIGWPRHRLPACCHFATSEYEESLQTAGLDPRRCTRRESVCERAERPSRPWLHDRHDGRKAIEWKTQTLAFPRL